MTLDHTSEFDKDKPEAGDTSSDSQVGGRYVAIETTPHMPPDMTKRGRSEHGRRLANTGIFLMVISGMIWFTLGNAPFWLASPSWGLVWFVNFVRQLSVIGAFGGLVAVVIGYAQLVLFKQVMLKQYLIAQLKSAASSRPAEDAAIDATGKEGESLAPPKTADGWIVDDLLPQKGATNLQRLSLFGKPVTNAGLERLKELTNLVELDLGGTQVTDAGLEHLKKLGKLERLDLHNTQVTDAGLEHLEGLISLKWLRLYGTRITEEGVKGLQQALPNCEVFRCCRL